MVATFIAEIGVGLAGFGLLFLFLGVVLLFDKGLLAIGNVSTLLYSSEFYLDFKVLFCLCIMCIATTCCGIFSASSG